MAVPHRAEADSADSSVGYVNYLQDSQDLENSTIPLRPFRRKEYSDHVNRYANQKDVDGSTLAA